MTDIDSVILEVADLPAAEAFYRSAFDLTGHLGLRQVERATAAAPSGFRGYTLSLVVSGPGAVDSLVGSAIAAGATAVKPVTKSFWGYGGSVRAPDGAIWKIATSSKKDAGPVSRDYDDFVLLLGVADVKASKQFYSDHGLTVAKSFGSKYVEFRAAHSGVKLALYSRRALAKDAGVSPEGDGPHGVVIAADTEPFTDPDGFAWEAVAINTPNRDGVG